LFGDVKGDFTVIAELSNNYNNEEEMHETKEYKRQSSMRTLSPEELHVKVFEKYSTIGPEVDKRYFVNEE